MLNICENESRNILSACIGIALENGDWEACSQNNIFAAAASRTSKNVLSQNNIYFCSSLIFKG